MTATELAMTEWDDIEAVYTKDNKEHRGEFRLNKRGYVLYEKEDGSEVKILVSNIKFVDHR